MNVLDASAVLAFLQGDSGAEVVEDALREGATIGAANWSEAMQKVLAGARSWDLSAALLASYGMRVEPVTVEDAEEAARAWRRTAQHSLGDRLCLALGERLDATVLTADRAWGSRGRVRQIR